MFNTPPAQWLIFIDRLPANLCYYTPMPLIESLLAKHPLISNQVSRPQVEVILRELERVLSQEIPGDIVEFGCYIGTTSHFIRRLLDAHGHPERSRGISPLTTPSGISPRASLGRDDAERLFHVYDSFEGLPPKSTWDASITGEQFTAGELAVSKKQFLREFQKAHLRPPTIHKAWFKDLTAADVPAHIAFAFLDGDFYESIRDSLRLVVPRLCPGATVVIDDYARESLPGAARATHEFFPATKIKVIHNLGVIHA